MKKSVLAIIAVVVVCCIYVVSQYNSMVGLDENVTKVWADVEAAYQRRADLIPNLVATVKGYAEHEKSTFKFRSSGSYRNNNRSHGSYEIQRRFHTAHKENKA